MFLLCLKRKAHKFSKLAATKNFLCSMYDIGTTCFDKCF